MIPEIGHFALILAFSLAVNGIFTVSESVTK